MIAFMIFVAVMILQATNARSSYDVEGCFSEFHSIVQKNMLNENSNVACQGFCRGQGLALAATHNGDICQCGITFPAYKNVTDDKCNSQCVTYLKCYSVQECCGGVDSYTVSMVGDIDTTLQVLKRVSSAYLNNNNYRYAMEGHMKNNSRPKQFPPDRHLVDWNAAPNNFNKEGWAQCGANEYMTGIKIGDSGNTGSISFIDAAECSFAYGHISPNRDSITYDQDWNGNPPYNINHPGWAKCKPGYFMHGMKRTSGNQLHNIESARCSKLAAGTGRFRCEVIDVTFDKPGTSSCPDVSFLAGLYRSECDYLHCIEKFFCCEMSGNTYSWDSWVHNPKLNVLVTKADGQLQSCSMRANDTTVLTDSYECHDITTADNMLELEAMKFEIQDETPLNTAQPEPIPGVDPVQCIASPEPYSCNKEFDTAITQSSTFTIGSGFSTSVGISTGVEIDAEFMGSGTKTNFQKEVSSSASFNCESSRTRETSTTDKTSVTVMVPANKQVMMNLMRTTVDVQYRWKGDFKAVGVYNIIWDNGYVYLQDITTAITGDKLNIYGFGTWDYPDTDVIEVLVTDESGNKVVEGCDRPVQQAGETPTPNNCTFDVNTKSEMKEEL